MSKTPSLKQLLKDANDRVKEAAAEALNEAAAELTARVRENMNAQNIKNDTGRLRASVKYKKTDSRKLAVVVKSEVYKRPNPKRPGSRNPRMAGRYTSRGVPYGRIIEFSPRIRKPFFYPAWYATRKQIREEIVKQIGEAWSK